LPLTRGVSALRGFRYQALDVRGVNDLTTGHYRATSKCCDDRFAGYTLVSCDGSEDRIESADSEKVVIRNRYALMDGSSVSMIM
jgi:hypothetical protein